MSWTHAAAGGCVAACNVCVLQILRLLSTRNICPPPQRADLRSRRHRTRCKCINIVAFFSSVCAEHVRCKPFFTPLHLVCVDASVLTFWRPGGEFASMLVFVICRQLCRRAAGQQTPVLCAGTRQSQVPARVA